MNDECIRQYQPNGHHESIQKCDRCRSSASKLLKLLELNWLTRAQVSKNLQDLVRSKEVDGSGIPEKKNEWNFMNLVLNVIWFTVNAQKSELMHAPFPVYVPK